MSEISNLELPSSGQYPLYVWLEDAAGNADHRSAELVHLRLDAEAPSIAFHASQDPANPTEVRAAAHDPVSGVVTGSIELRPLGSTTWQPLETRFEGRDLVATFPDDRLPRGSYELRARARDAAGNQGASQRRETGRIMILDSPIRTDTRLTAGFLVRRGRLVRTGGRLAPAVTVAFAQGGVLRGRLQTSEGISLSDAPVTIESRVVARTAVRILGQALTDRDGRFWFRIPAGASRTLRISYSGSRLIRPVQTTARLNVRAYATLRLSPRRLRVGQRVLFAGAVRGGRVYLPSRGKLIQIQFRDGRIWRPAVRLGRTGRDGRYGIRYRFQRISRPTRVVFRILVPAEENWPFETGTSPARHVDVYPRR